MGALGVPLLSLPSCTYISEPPGGWPLYIVKPKFQVFFNFQNEDCVAGQSPERREAEVQRRDEDVRDAVLRKTSREADAILRRNSAEAFRRNKRIGNRISGKLANPKILYFCY